MALTEAQLEAKVKQLETQLAQHAHTGAGKGGPRLEIKNLKGIADSKVKVSETDAVSYFLSNKLVEGSGAFFQTITDENNKQTLKINGDLVFGGNGSDGDLIIANGETVTLDAATDIQIKNYSSINIQSGGVLNIQNTNTAPVVLKSSGNITIAGTINFNGTYNSATVYPASLLASGATFTPTGKLDTNKGGTDLIINCEGNFNATGGTINLGATAPAISGVLRIVAGGTYTAGTYTASSTTVINNPTIF